MHRQHFTRDEYEYRLATLHWVENQLVSARSNLKKVMSRLDTEVSSNQLYIDTLNALILNLRVIRDQIHHAPDQNETRTRSA